MDIVKFESIMQRYFEKALVALLKKGVAYDNSNDLPTYLLIDKKRAVYYIAESDIYDGNISTPELDIILDTLSTRSELSKEIAYAVARLVYAYRNIPENFNVSEIDLTQLTKLSALIISKNRANEIKLFLQSQNIITQNVEFKGGFLLLFFDETATNQIIAIARGIADINAEPERRRIITPDSVDEITDETIINTTTTEVEENNNLVADESELDNLDLSSFIPPTPVNDANADLSDDDFFEVMVTGADEKSKTVTTADTINNENPETAENLTDENLDDSSSEDEEYDEDSDDDSEETPPENQVPPKKNKHILSHLTALIFMTPAYVLNRITLGKLPGFIIYWFTMLAIFFGIYEIPVSHVVEYYYALGSKLINSNIIQMTDISAIIVTSLSFTQSIEPKTAAELISNPLISSVGFIASVSTFLSQYELSEVIGNSLILKYALTFSVFLMLSPSLRLTGLRLYASFMLLFLTIPFILLGQSYLLAMLSENISYLIANPMANPPSGLFMLQSLFAMITVFVLPIIIFLIYFTFFGSLIRNNNSKGVLP